MDKISAEKIEHVFDLVDRGVLNSVDEVMGEFAECDVDKALLRKIVEEEFEMGYSDKWETL